MSTTDPASGPEPHEVFARVGGLATFERIVDAFYARVESDELLRPIYPEDLEPGKRRLALFLAQYWGGGDVYSRERGHPRLRMRHAPFTITPQAAMRWAELMTEAIREQDLDPAATDLILDYVAWATPTMINALPDGVEVLPDADGRSR